MFPNLSWTILSFGTPIICHLHNALDKSKICSVIKSYTLYIYYRTKQINIHYQLFLFHAVLTLIYPLENIVGKNKMLAAFSSFPTMFSTLLTTEIIILERFNVSSANALNLTQTKNLSFGKESAFYNTIQSLTTLHKGLLKDILAILNQF